MISVTEPVACISLQLSESSALCYNILTLAREEQAASHCINVTSVDVHVRDDATLKVGMCQSNAHQIFFWRWGRARNVHNNTHKTTRGRGGE
jgi:hypothetical protein